MFERLKNWPFLNEPLYRWAIFALAMILILCVWGRVLYYMQDVA